MKLFSSLLSMILVLFFAACSKTEEHGTEHANHADEHGEQAEMHDDDAGEHAEPDDDDDDDEGDEAEEHAHEEHMATAGEYAALEGFEMTNASTYGDFVFGGQPTPADLEALKARGVTKIVDLRTAPEPRGMDEPAVCEELGLEYVSLPFSPRALDDKVVDGILEEMEQGGSTLVHCGSGNRVQLLFAMHRVLEEGADVDAAMALGREYGMSEGSEAISRQLLSARGH